ncbi:hypothetical protein FH608_028760 [Nonomuraea phyllanthi]|uniref:Uncharacterized protein n=1 Tax=Nonomuraea phyllanthi TaxID=2219224 RepID=A0A5C4W4Y7_9ACTN|nr:hypothetical protein [Nonomuraea phyllanthi]KAB8191938.1 hypothetical protein FH608_028760 [Nonomuraea phyllanthi]
MRRAGEQLHAALEKPASLPYPAPEVAELAGVADAALTWAKVLEDARADRVAAGGSHQAAGHAP